MNETSNALNQPRKWIRLVARIWSAPIILISFFIAIGNIWSWLTNGVADPYAVEEATFLESLPPTLMFFSAIGLALAWRWEKFGGVFSLIFAAGTVVVLVLQGRTSGDLAYVLIPYLLSLAFLIPGVLFLIYGLQANKSEQ